MGSASTYRMLLADGILFTISAVLMGSLLTRTFAKSEPSEEGKARRIGQLERRSSEVRRRADGSLVWRELDRLAPIFEGDAVYAGPDSEAVIALDDGSSIEVDQRSLVVVHRVSGREEALPLISVEVLRGAASGKAGSGQVAIQAGGASLMVEKGGKASVLVAENRSAKIDVDNGRAVVETKTGSVTVGEGQRGMFDATGERTGPIQRLSISLVQPGPGARWFVADPKDHVVFQWQPHEGVAPYVWELSRNAEFTDIIAVERTETPRVVRKSLEEGIYYWRVSRKLRAGKACSEDRKLALLLDTPPIPYEPRASQVVDLSESESVPFSWGEVPDVGRYQIEVAEGPSFDKPVARATVNQPAYRLDKRLKEGRYCFRVRSQEAERPHAPWSKVTCFRAIVRPIYRAPKGFKPRREVVPTEEKKPERSWLWFLFGSVAYADAPKPTAIVIRWERIPGAPSYLIEIAEDEAFGKIVVKKRVTRNYYNWRTVVRRPHYWRVRVIDVDGREGDVSEPIRIDPEVSPPILSSPPSAMRFAYGASAPRITLGWKGSEVFEKYIVEISTDASFARETTSKKVIGTTRYIFEAVQVGEYYWRVTGIDLLGKPTPRSERRHFVVFADAPKANEPSDKQVFVWEEESFDVKLSWSKRPVSSYEIQVAENARFSRPVSKTTSRSWLRVTPPSMGTLYWRVRGASPVTAWSKSSRIEVIPKVPLPSYPLNESSEDFEGDQKTIELRWDKVPGITTYEVTLTRQGTDTQEPVETHRVEGTTTSFDLKEGRYNWTVRAVHGSGAVSAESAAQSFTLIEKEPETEVIVAHPAVEPQPFIDARPSMDDTEQEPPIDAVVEPSGAVIHVAPRIGFLYNFGAIIAPSFGAEIGYLPPILGRHIRVALSVSYLTSEASKSSKQDGASFESRLHSIPFELVVVYIIPTSLVDLYGGGGLLVDLRNRNLQVPSQPMLEQTDVEFGGVVLIGSARQLGLGSLFAQLSYALATNEDRGIVESAPGGLGVSLGYRIGIW